jgi:hypothetical protein
VDDNPQTRPVENIPLTKILNPLVALWNQEQLLRYHFVLSNYSSGKVNTAYQDSDLNAAVSNPSTQLNFLQGASEKAPNPCAKAQLFGEFLHGFEDTYSHRKKDNTPYNATNWLSLGTGHGLADGSEPDYTFDNPSNGWTVRENRTLEMELAVLGKFEDSGLADAKNQKADGIALIETLKEFNSKKEWSKGGGEKDFLAKIDILQSKLDEWQIKGADGVPVKLLEVNGAYNEDKAKTNRNKHLCDKGKRLKQSDYPGTMLPKEDVPC